MNLVVLVNRSAGMAPDRGSQEVRAALGSAGLTAEIIPLAGPELAAAVRHACRRGADIVAVAGGDGSLNAAAAELAGSTAALAVLPLGTFNHFAKDLGIPLDLAGAVRVLAEGRAVPVDIAEVNGRVFINHSAIGIYPTMLRHRELQRVRLRRHKWIATGVATLAAFRAYPTLGLRIRVAGDAIARRTPFVFVGNNGYILDSYGIDAGAGRDKLALVIAHDVGPLALARLAAKAFSGRLGRDPRLDALSFTSAFIESRRRAVRVELDGEVAMLEPPLRYRLRPGALRVIQPVPAAELSTTAAVPSDGGGEPWIGTGSAAAGSASRDASASASAS